MYNISAKNIGEFIEVDHGLSFTYTDADPVKDRYFIGEGYPHLIDTVGGLRYGLVKKTVLYIVVDEIDAGLVTEKWKIKKHIIYNKA